MFAVDAEFATWRRMTRFEAVGGAAAPTYVMRMPGAEVYAVIAGI